MSIPFPLLGNRPIRQLLGDGSHLSHAYMLSGAPGSGRHTLARYLTQLLVCSGDGERPCGRCPDCRKAAEGIHPDVITLAPAEGKKEIQVDDVRKMRTDAYIRPNEAGRKVYLIENAGSMNEKAQNTVLKLIEDGPDYAAFLFLVGHSEELLQTIRSRCEELKLTPLSQNECIQALAARFPDRTPQALENAAQSCQGILGQGIALLSGEAADDTQAREWAEEFCLALSGRDELSLGRFLALHDKSTREELSAFCRQCQSLIHQALMYRSGGSCPSLPDSAFQLARTCSGHQLLTVYQLLETTLRGFEVNAGQGHSLGWLTVSCIEAI